MAGSSYPIDIPEALFGGDFIRAQARLRQDRRRCSTTVAPRRRQFITFISGAKRGITTVTECQATGRDKTGRGHDSRGRGNHAVFFLFRWKRQERVAGAAFLETAGALQVFQFAINVKSRGFGQRNGTRAGRLNDVSRRSGSPPPGCRWKVTACQPLIIREASCQHRAMAAGCNLTPPPFFLPLLPQRRSGAG